MIVSPGCGRRRAGFAAVGIACVIFAGCTPEGSAVHGPAGIVSGLQTQWRAAEGVPVPRQGPGGNVRPLRQPPVRAAVTGAHHGRRAQAEVASSGERQIAGMAFSVPDGAPVTSFVFKQTADARLALPAPASGVNQLLSPDTTFGSTSCLEVKTVYWRGASDSATTRQVHAYDDCAGAEYVLATVDSAFVSKYERDDGDGTGLHYTVYVGQVSGATNWQVGLLDNSTNQYDVLYTTSAAAPVAVGGQSVVNVDTFAPGACPPLSPQHAGSFYAIYGDGSTGYLPVTVISPVDPGTNGAADCYSSAASSSPYYYVLDTPGQPNGTAGYTVRTAPTATPVPTAAPTATPSPAPLAYVLNTPTLTARAGATAVFPCVFRIATYSAYPYTLDDYVDMSSTGGGSFPTYNHPAPNPLSWSIPDLSRAGHGYTNVGPPGQTTWSGTAGQSQTHCVDLTLVVPGSVAPGAYRVPIDYLLFVQPPGGGSQESAAQTITLGVTVTP